MKMENIPHAIVVPYPAQGHVIPMLELSQRLVKQGVKVTFVNTDFNHKRVESSLPPSVSEEAVTMVSIPDGLEPWEDRNDLGKLTSSIWKVMPAELEALINGTGEPKVVCVIADWTMFWAFDVAERLGLRRAVFCSAAAATLALTFSLPKLVSDGIIDENGKPLKEQVFELSPSIPSFHTTNFTWASVGDEVSQKVIFQMLYDCKLSNIRSTDRILCNSSDILEPGALALFPEAKPIGPLLTPHKSINGSFWKQDSTCLSWLDQQPPNSVIYAAFGSFTIFNPKQFLEFALGLELTGRPFLWVVRSDAAAAAGGGEFPDGFGERGRVVKWAPQQEVLSHPSVACFVSHCGWNSTIEGASNGVPFLCWPYFADQFLNQDYICDEWKVGLRLEKDEKGIIGRDEVKEKVRVILGDGGFKERAVNLREEILESVKGGDSHANFSSFIQWVKNTEVQRDKPAQGHVIPLMELAQRLVNNGIRVTFVNTESNHARVVEALPPDEKQHELLHLVSISDGLESWEDRLDIAKAMQALGRVVPAEVEALIESTNATQADAVTCILTDFYMAGVTQAYEKFSLKTAAFVPGSAALLASTISADKLLEDGVVDTNGTPLHSGAIKLSPSMPEMNPNHLPWVCLPDLHQRSVFFRFLLDNNKSAKLAQFLICNTAPELEAAALDFMPKCLPIGPLLASSRLGKQSGYFWPENPTCLSWLDQQTPNSVVYVAFGSFTVLDSVQFRELALGLELAGKPFLWVVRQDITTDLDKAYPIGFEERVRNQGKMVNWAPQQQVLSHPSIACFVSHCGWNSTVESVSNGVPILCWPYFTDQFLNETYIVDHWRVGLRLEKDDSGTFRKEEIKKKLEVILSDEEEGCRRRVVKLREKTLASGNGGICNRNLRHFMDWINEK